MSLKICPRAKDGVACPFCSFLWQCVHVWEWMAFRVIVLFSLLRAKPSRKSFRPQCSQSLSLSQSEAGSPRAEVISRVRLSTLKLTQALKLCRCIHHVTARHNNRSAVAWKISVMTKLSAAGTFKRWVKDWIRANWEDADWLGQPGSILDETS